jgi:hypothetical protein
VPDLGLGRVPDLFSTKTGYPGMNLQIAATLDVGDHEIPQVGGVGDQVGTAPVSTTSSIISVERPGTALHHDHDCTAVTIPDQGASPERGTPSDPPLLCQSR